MNLCSHYQECPGCDYWGISYQEEKKLKIENLKNFLSHKFLNTESLNIQFHSLAGPTQIRDRVDLQWRKNIGWGYVHGPSSKLIPILKCLLMTEPLSQFYEFIKTINLPYEKASIRLRVSPKNEWGLWLDLPNNDIKDLLENQSPILDKLLSKSIVEIGQKRKRLIKNPDLIKYKLDKNPHWHNWFVTSNLQGKDLPLYSLVGGFTQVGFEINKILVIEVLKLIKKLKFKNNFELAESPIVELGAGIGNFTFGFLSEGYKVIAIENDPQALDALKFSLENHYYKFTTEKLKLSDQLKIVGWNFLKNEPPPFATSGILFVDPPRSGLGKFLENPIWKSDPSFEYIIYVSCSLESWKLDFEKLSEKNYDLKNISIVDQFSRSKNVELISVFQKSTAAIK